MSWYADRLKRLRTDQRMSQQQLADKSKMTKAYVGQVERGERKPSFDVVERIAAALGAKIYISLENPEPPALNPKNKPKTSIASRFNK
mgnify:CR=1 FL=1|tara:strand:+ start:207 stop:470 length:264 start_codon:yes stop_codon:yes gene_type:complete